MPFDNPIVGGNPGVLLIPSMQSPNYATGVSGWIIRQNGSAEFANVIIRGSVVAGIAPTQIILDNTVPALEFTTVHTPVGDTSRVIGSDTSSPAGTGMLLQSTSYTDPVNPARTVRYFLELTPGRLNLGRRDFGTVQNLGPQVNLGDSVGVIQYVDPFTGNSVWALTVDGTGVKTVDGAGNTSDVLFSNNSGAAGNVTAARAACTVLLGLPTSATNVAGCVINFTTTRTGAWLDIDAVWEVQVTTAIGAGGLANLTCTLDGSPIVGDCNEDANSVHRSSVGRSWRPVPVPTPGAHVLRLQARKTIAAGAVNVLTANTEICATVYDVD